METNSQQAKKIWEKLINVPLNKKGEIQIQFLHFEVGTHRFEIWGWLEKTFDVRVGKELFF